MDTSNLTREQKEQLLQLLQQKALLKQEQVLDTFKPHPVQEKFLKSQAKIRALFSGNGLGKTTVLAVDMIYTHTCLHPYRNTDNVRHSWLLVPSFDKAEDLWSEIKKWCPPSKLPKPNKMGSSVVRRLEWQNGSITTIYSHEQESSKLEGTNLDFLYADEPPPRDLFIAAFRGLRNNPDYGVVLACTPLGANWLYEDFYQKAVIEKDENIEVFTGSTFDNPHLSKEFVEHFASQLSDDEKRARLYGEFTFLQGRVFKEFSRQTHVFKYKPIPDDHPIYCCIDPHPRKPTCVAYLTVLADDTLVVCDELKVDGTVEDVAEAMRALEKKRGYKVICRRIDNSASSMDWNRTSYVAQLDEWSRKNNYNVRVSPMRKSEKDIEAGINKMRKLFKNRQLIVLDSCPNVIIDLERYAWQDHRHPENNGLKETPRKVYDDFCDLIRYLVASNPIHSPSLTYITMLDNGKAAYNKDAKPPRKPSSPL